MYLTLPNIEPFWLCCNIRSTAIQCLQFAYRPYFFLLIFPSHVIFSSLFVNRGSGVYNSFMRTRTFFYFVSDAVVLSRVTGRCVDVDIGDKLLSLSRLFADDTSLGYTSQDEDQIKYVINHDLHELGDWSKRWLMSFNPDKTEIILFKNVENSISMPIPRHYSYGPRKLNIILTQLRCNASFLNYDLCKVKILSNASCNCGAPCENSHHFFFDCDKHTDNREIIFNSLNWLPSNINIDVNLLTKGSDLLTSRKYNYF